MTACAVRSAATTETTGSTSSDGLRYVISSMTMTTASAARSRVESMPEKASDESAATPPGPVMWTVSPPPPSPTMSRTESTAGPIRSQPFSSMVIGTKIWAAEGAVLVS